MTDFNEILNDIIGALRHKYLNKKLVPVIGAGFSMPFSLPNWSCLLLSICEEFKLESHQVQAVSDLCGNGDYIRAVDMLVAFTNGNKSEKDIQFSVAKIISEKLKELKSLSKITSLKDSKIINNYGDIFKYNFKTVLTLNYDEILADYASCEYSQSTIKQFTHTQDIGDEKNIIYVHGRISEPESIILAKAHYNEVYSTEDFTKKLGAFTLDRTFLFLGFSFQDEYIKKFLETITQNCKVTHYALMDKLSVQTLDVKKIAELNEKYSIQIIQYDDSQNGHAKSISTFLETICDGIKLFPQTIFKVPLPYKTSKNKFELYIDKPKLAIDNIPKPLNTDYYGRKELLKQLINLLEDSQPIISIYGFAGMGKTSLIFTWINSIAPNYCGARKIFYWKFEAQDKVAENVSAFFESAIKFFSEEKNLPSEYNQSTILLKYLNQNKFILILDDFESLYDAVGEINIQLKTLLQTVARDGLDSNGLIILLSIHPVEELELYKGKSFYKGKPINVPLPVIGESECKDIFKLYNIRGTEHQLAEVAHELNYYPLSITLLSRILKKFYGSDINRRNEINLYNSKEVNDEFGETLLINLFKAYKHIWEFNSGVSAFFNKVCFFRHSFNINDVKQIFKNFKYTEKDINFFWNILIESELISYNEFENGYNVCTIIRDHVYFEYQRENEEEFINCNRIFGNYYVDSFDELYSSDELLSQIKTIHAVEPLYDAIFYFTHANMYEKAFHILWDKIYRGRSFFSQKVLGAFSNDIFAISQFFDISNGWKPKCDRNLCAEDIAWLYAVSAYLKRNIGSLEESIELRELELNWQKSLKNYNFLASDSTHLARSYMLRCQPKKASETFEQAYDYLLKAQEIPYCGSNGQYSSQLDLNTVRSYLYVRWAHFHYSRGFKQEAIKCINFVDKNMLKDKTDIFYYLLISITYCANKKELAGLVNYFKEYENKPTQSFAYSFKLFLNGLLNLKRAQLSKKLKKYTYDNFKNILCEFDKSIEISKKFQRMDQYPDMLLLYMNIIIEYIPKDYSIANQKFNELSSEVDNVLNIYDIPFYRGEYIYLCIKHAKASKKIVDYNKLYAEFFNHSEYVTFFQGKINDLEMN